MSSSRFADRLLERAGETGAVVSPQHVLQFERYYDLLRRWNRKINLTALPLDLSPVDETLDRLFLEPVVAAGFIEDEPLVYFDLGSGGGSPAIPLRIVRDRLLLTMVEARERKAAFLREVVRHLELTGVGVLTSRIDELPSTTEHIADVVTVRGVRPDGKLIGAIRTLLKENGRLVTFGVAAVPEGFVLTQQRQLKGNVSGLNLLRCRS